MPKWQYLRLRSIALWTALLGLSAFAFNNCSTQSASPLTAASLTNEQRQSILYKDEPFAYDGIIDTISYNSCFGDGITSGGVFGIKASASETPPPGEGPKSGIRLTKEFLDFVGTKLKPEYPSEVITQAQLKNFLTHSPLSGSATPLLGFRYTKDLGIRAENASGSSASFLGGVDFAEPLGTLSNKLFIGDLTEGIAFDKTNKIVSYGPRVADFPFADTANRNLKGELGYNLKGNYYELYGNYLRDEMNVRNVALTLTYHDSTAANGAINPISPSGSDLKKAFGRIFYLSFGSIVGAAHNSVPSNLLKTVEERDLSKLSLVSNASWTCRNFMVVRAADREKFCKPMDYSVMAASNGNYRN